MSSAKCKKTDIERIVAEKGKRGDFSPRQSDHCHNFYELIYMLSGECRFLLNDSVYRLVRGDLILAAPGDLHHALYETSTCEIMAVYFKKDYIDWNLLKKLLPQPGSRQLHSFMGSIPPLYQEEFNCPGCAESHLFQQKIQAGHRHGLQGISELCTSEARSDRTSNHLLHHYRHRPGKRLQRQQLFQGSV